MGKKMKGSDKVGQIVIGFGILFSGLLNMTDAVSTLTESGIIENLFSRLGENPFIGYVIGAGVAFVLQSSSATIGILQAFSTSGLLTFSGIYAVLTGVYLGDCVTTAIVCNIGARPNAKRVGIVNILFNLSKTLMILIGVNIVHQLGWIDHLWNSTMLSGGIANTNTVFNLSCAILMLPVVNVYEKLSMKLVKDEPEEKTAEQSNALQTLNALNPVFFSTPALAFNSCYSVLLEMFHMSQRNINRAFDLLNHFDEEMMSQINEDEEIIDMMADKVSNYLIQISAHITADNHVEILNHYYAAITEFERLGDHAMNIAETAEAMKDDAVTFSDVAMSELNVLRGLIETVLAYTSDTFERCDTASARHIEPLEEVVDDMVNALKQNHLDRLRDGNCSVLTGTNFLNILSDIERVSDICSNVGTATIARAHPEMKHEIHDYVSRLHSGNDEAFNREYHEAHDRHFRMLSSQEKISV